MQWPASTGLCWWSLGGGWLGCPMGCGSTFVNLLLLVVSQIWRTRLYWLIKVCNRCLDLKRNNVDVAVWIEWYRFAFFKKDSAPPFPPAFPISSSLRRNINRATFLWKVVLVPLFSKRKNEKRIWGVAPLPLKTCFWVKKNLQIWGVPLPLYKWNLFWPSIFLGWKIPASLAGKKSRSSTYRQSAVSAMGQRFFCIFFVFSGFVLAFKRG